MIKARRSVFITSPTRERSNGNPTIQHVYKGELMHESNHAAARWAQSELFFRLLLKNTVCAPQIAAYANFWEGSLLNESPTSQSKFVFHSVVSGTVAVQFGLGVTYLCGKLNYLLWSQRIICPRGHNGTWLDHISKLQQHRIKIKN